MYFVSCRFLFGTLSGDPKKHFENKPSKPPSARLSYGAAIHAPGHVTEKQKMLYQIYLSGGVHYGTAWREHLHNVRMDGMGDDM